MKGKVHCNYQLHAAGHPCRGSIAVEEAIDIPDLAL